MHKDIWRGGEIVESLALKGIQIQYNDNTLSGVPVAW